MDSELYRRSREIGQALARARRRLRRTQQQCADEMGTTRKRYAGIERGASFIAAVELERLVKFLAIAPYDVWPAELILPYTRQIHTHPGERLLVIVDADSSLVDNPEPDGES